MNRLWPLRISTPHIELAIPVSVGLTVMKSTGGAVFEEADGAERTYRVNLRDFDMAIYDSNGVVSSVWYNDPAGRSTRIGRNRKIQLYMARYTISGTWEKRIDNGWMSFYFNDVDGVQIVHGIKMDVLRINRISNEAAAA